MTTVELEPHFVVDDYYGYGANYGGLPFGVGFRATIPIVSNGFVSSINDSVGIGLGLDWVRYAPFNGAADVDFFTVPIVMQWNFYLTHMWSVFGEVGGAIFFADHNCGYYNGYHCDNFSPFNFDTAVGGRLHFNDSISLTVRLGFPASTIGVSFFP